MAENTRIRNFIDQQNGINGYWKEYEPNVGLATIPEEHATHEVSEAFLDIAPEEFTFEPAQPIVS